MNNISQLKQVLEQPVELALDVKTITQFDIDTILAKRIISFEEFALLISPQALPYIESIAQKAREITDHNFGRQITLYTPLYLSNYCENNCLYCGFREGNSQQRQQLSLEEIRKEAEIIVQSGLKNILILTGDARSKASPEYIKSAITILQEYFSAITIEIYAMDEHEYSELIQAGLYGLTIYQETYDQKLYEHLHPSGPKRDYNYRLQTPDAAAKAGIHAINIGALLGLGDYYTEAYALARHAHYLMNTYPNTEFSVSLPRMRPFDGSTQEYHSINDRQLVQLLVAMRIFLPTLGITISTREDAQLRDKLVNLGVTKMSAGSVTSVGGHQESSENPQFEIADERSVTHMAEQLLKLGFQPVYKEW